MTLSPLADSFTPCSDFSSLYSRHVFISSLRVSLSDFDFRLFMSILKEWESSPLIETCFACWEKSVSSTSCTKNGVQVLSFNVRGFDLRWQEVRLLVETYEPDVVILLETGDIDFNFSQEVFHDFSIFFQKGENRNGGALIMVRSHLYARRIHCDVPNVCVVELPGEENLRIIGLYAPASRSWSWDQLSPFISKSNVLFGDFNVDLEADNDKASILLRWADEFLLAPYLPSGNTSLRSNRTIDFAFSNVHQISLTIHKGGTTSDHVPIISVIHNKRVDRTVGNSIHWKVFNMFTEYTYSYWENQWSTMDADLTYTLYTRFLFLLKARCTTFFPVKKYRASIPPDLRVYMSYVRALSFRQARTKCAQLKYIVKVMRTRAKQELQAFLKDQFFRTFNQRHTTRISVSFWTKAKQQITRSQSKIYGLLAGDGSVVKDKKSMCTLAAQYYGLVFSAPDNIVRPHPYTDLPHPHYEWSNEAIPPVTSEELLASLVSKKVKKSTDAHGISPFMLNSLHTSHWKFLLHMYNRSFSECFIPSGWKDTRIVLLAKKEHICEPSDTRPISLLDTFQKIGEKLFLSRYKKVLDRLGVLPNSQSGFRESHRLQTRVLLFIDDICSYLSNSSPITTLFVDFKRAFDMLWHTGCIGKLLHMGVPVAYTRWILRWLENRRGFVEIGNCRSDWFAISKGGPQGGVLTPTLFVSYHADMPQFLSCASSHLFADDLAAIIAGGIGSKYRSQCIDLERRVKLFLDELEAYCILSGQPVNFSKTEALWSSRAIGAPSFDVVHHDISIRWTKSFKYLGYWICPKLGWSKMIHCTKVKIRQRLARISSFKLYGNSSNALRKGLFNSFVLPLFTWLFPIFPLFSDKQRAELEHFYFTCIKRIRSCNRWSDELVAFAFDEISLQDRCVRYWEKFLVHCADSEDGQLLLERANWNCWRNMWVNRDISIKGMRISRRFKENSSVLGKVLDWLAGRAGSGSVPDFDWEDVNTLRFFSETFL